MMKRFVANKLWLGVGFATIFITVAAIDNIFMNTDVTVAEELEIAKYQACESEVVALLGGSPVFDRGGNSVSDDGATVTGNMDVVPDVTGEAIDRYTCRVETVNGEIVATVESVE